MQQVVRGFHASRMIFWAAVVALLLVALLGALGAGPDEPPGESAIKVGNGGDGDEPAGANPGAKGASPGANESRWDVFEGHSFTAGLLTPNGLPLVACLGGCEAGYVSDPVTVGAEGRYTGLKVSREQSDADAGADGAGMDGDVVTFWLVGEENRVRADQAVLFLGNAETRKLHLSFPAVPTVPGVEQQEEVAAVPVEEPPRWSTTDLTLPNPAELGLLPSGSAQGFAATTFRYGGIPLLPGFIIVLGLLLALIGASMLIYRRRLTW